MNHPNQSCLTIAILAACLVLAGCRGKETVRGTEPTGTNATTERQTASQPTYRFRIHAELPEFTFTLVGDPVSESKDLLHVKKIEVRRGASSAPIQVIEGLDTATPISSNLPALAVLDMNFDGYADIRLVESQPAGPNIPYLNWLFDPGSGRFVESPALNAITSPQFDPATREIRSNWRDGATRYGTDVYVVEKDGPVLVRKELKVYKDPGVYTSQVSEFVDGVWKIVEQREVRDP
jgi:hypothetical protein